MYPCEMKNKLFLEQALGPVPQRVNFLLGDFLWGGHPRVPLTSSWELVFFDDAAAQQHIPVIPNSRLSGGNTQLRFVKN